MADGMREIRTDVEVLAHAIADGINVYIRDVLIPRGAVSKDAWTADDDLTRLKYEVAAAVAENWAVSWSGGDESGGPASPGDAPNPKAGPDR